MWIYFTVFIVVALSLFLSNKIKDKKNIKHWKVLSIICEILAILTLALFFGLRDHSVGTDTLNYYKMYNKLNYEFSIDKMFEYDYLYSVLNILCNVICKDFTFCLIVIGVIIYSNLVFSINRLSSNPILSISLLIGLGFYAQSFNAIRQYLALSFVVLGLYFYLKSNP